MPIYEFVCNKCNNRFELLRPFSRASESADCPKCKGKSERVMSVCMAISSGENGIPQPLNNSSCSSCSSGNCSSCSH